MKSSTTYLSELLGAHPDVFMSAPKEPCYFVDQRELRSAWPYMWQQGWWKSESRYLSLFARSGDAKVIAEASTVYSKLPRFGGVPERILDFNPQSRFIYIMRDPVERTISHYWHRVRWWRERRMMLAAIRSDPQYLDVSYYAMQLNAYFRHVAFDRLLVLTHEALVAEPAVQIARVYEWLRIDSSFRPPNLGIATNVRPQVVNQVRSLGLLERARPTLLYTRIGPCVPNALRRLYSSLTTRPIVPAAVPDTAVRDYLRSIQRIQTEELSKLLNRNFPEWRTLYDATPQ